MQLLVEEHVYVLVCKIQRIKLVWFSDLFVYRKEHSDNSFLEGFTIT